MPLWIPKKDERFPAGVEEHRMDTEMMKTMMIVEEAAGAGIKMKTNMIKTAEATGAGMKMTMMIVV